MFLLILLAAVIVVAVVARRSAGRVPEPVRSAVRRGVRSARVALGEYSLANVMEAMIDDMLDSVLPSLTKSYVPNVVTFGLHAEDVRRWGAYFDQLAAELRALVLAHVARRADLALCGQLEVELIEDVAARPGRPTLTARMRRPEAQRVRRDTAAAAEAVVTEPATKFMPVGSDATVLDETALAGPRWGLQLLGISGTRLVELGGEALVGRGDDAVVRLADRGVSRRHARITLVDDEVSVLDLGSSNGTFVNDERVTMAMLAPGDRLRFGRRANAELIRLGA